MDEGQIEQMKAMGAMTSNANVDNQRSDITHVNAVSYNAELDHIAMSCPGFGEIYIIDHSISTEEAKGSAGDLLYRWGNPQNYGAGTKEDQKLFGQHDVKYIPKGFPGEGHLMAFNNDIHNPDNKLPSLGAALAKAQSPDKLNGICSLSGPAMRAIVCLSSRTAGRRVEPDLRSGWNFRRDSPTHLMKSQLVAPGCGRMATP